MNIFPAVLSFAALLAASPAVSADIGFGPGQSLDAADALARARATRVPSAVGIPAEAPAEAPADAQDPAKFLARLDGTRTGSAGRLSVAGDPRTLVSVRVIAQQKTQEGLPAVTLRMLRRYSRDANPAHVETVFDEMTLIAKGAQLVVRRANLGDEVARVELSKTDALSFTFLKSRGLWGRGVDVFETWTLTLENGRLTAARREVGTAGELASESFSAN